MLRKVEMIMKKKWMCLILTAVLALSAVGTFAAEVDADVAYVQEKGVLVVGITDFAPMDYLDNGEWIGFDADMAKAFAASLGLKVEFIEIDWDNKLLELDNKSIDCIWNGMTLTEEIMGATSCSKPYANNAQVIVVPKDVADQYQTAEAAAQLQFAVEAGSAGQSQAEAYGFSFTPVSAQTDAVMEVKAGSSDAAIIDALMAAAVVGEGTDARTYAIDLNDGTNGTVTVGGTKYNVDVNSETDARTVTIGDTTYPVVSIFAFDLNKADTARADLIYILEEAKGRYADTRGFCGFEDRSIFRHGDLNAVYSQIYHL